MGVKKILMVIIAVFVPYMAVADDEVTVDGVRYTLNQENNTVTVTYLPREIPDMISSWDYTYSGDIFIPEHISHSGKTYTVTAIGRFAFYGCHLTSINLPNTITNISENAFTFCDVPSITIPGNVKSVSKGETSGAFSYSAVHSVTILDGVTSIASWFPFCEKLETISIPNSVTDINGAFYYCNSLQAISIPEGVTTIGNETFYNCTSLTSVLIPESVTSIGDEAFCGCKSLKSIIIPEGVTYIGLRALERCSGLLDIYCYPKNVPSGFNKIFYDSPSITLHVPDFAIESYKELLDVSKFKDIVVLEKATDFNLIYYVNGDEYKTIQYKYDDEITPIEEPTKKGMTFSGWSEIPEKMPGKDVKVTGTFSWSKVTKNGVIYQVYNAENELAGVIGSDNASGEVKIVSPIEIDGYKYSVTDIVDNVFKNNTDITSVVIPESVRKIGDEAFYGCKNLAKIELGKSVNQIEPRAFAGIDKLTDVTICAEDVPSTDRTAFENSYIEDYVTLHVPAGSVEKYKATAPWKNFKEIVSIPDADTDDTDVDVITIKSYGKGTYCSDYDLDFSDTENLKAFIVTGYDHKTNTIWLTRVKSVPAGTGIIVKGIPGDYRVKHVESLSVYANFLVGTTEDKNIKDVEDGMTNFVLSKGEWYRFDGEITLPKGMAYLPLPLSKFAGTRSLTEVYEDNDEGTTEIRTIEQGTVSSEHDVWFTLQGQRFVNPGKGLYIRNGKKVFIK